MRTPLPHFLALLLALAAPGAAAQLRTIPADATRASMRVVQDMQVEIDGKPMMLTPGAQIRDTFNRLVVPTSVAGKVPVRYLADTSGLQVHRVWILSDDEAAQDAPKPAPTPAPAPAPASPADEKKDGS